MEKRLVALRGAVCCENTKEDITKNVCLMCNEVFKQNNLLAQDLVSIQFSITNDITVLNPATALRTGQVCINVSEVPLFCCQEAFIEGGMKKVVRVLIHAYMNEFSPRHHVYLNGAEKLRPDFSK